MEGEPRVRAMQCPHQVCCPTPAQEEQSGSGDSQVQPQPFWDKSLVTGWVGGWAGKSICSQHQVQVSEKVACTDILGTQLVQRSRAWASTPLQVKEKSPRRRLSAISHTGPFPPAWPNIPDLRCIDWPGVQVTTHMGEGERLQSPDDAYRGLTGGG